MKKEISYQSGIVAQIWFASCVLNAALGTVVETVFKNEFEQGGLVTWLLLLIIALVYSIPTFACVLIFINRSVRKERSGRYICCGTYCLVAIISILVCLLFAYFNLTKNDIKILFAIIFSTELCTIMSVSIYYLALKGLGIENQQGAELGK